MPLQADPREAGANQEVEAGLPPALRAQLLDPAAWREGLEKYARAMHLAVALVDRQGSLLGACLNGRPLWTLLREALSAAAGECPFAVAPPRPCTCVADALKTGRPVRAQDRSGLVHFAVPLTLGTENVGALLAGQVFTRYPEQLPLEDVARRAGVSRARVWQTARLEHPVGPSMLRVYEDLLRTLGRSFLAGRYHMLLEASHLAELRRAEEALRQANADLEKRVQERTGALQEAQQKALQTERLAAVGQMMAGLAHESRNALQRIQAGLSRLGFRLQSQPEAFSLLESIQTAEDDLHRLFEQVRQYAAQIRLEPDLCDAAELWREAWAELAPARNGRQAELLEEPAGTDHHLVASPFHLKQVFRNLLHNSLTACHDQVRILIHCVEGEIEGRESIQFSVRDNGPGFAASNREKVFEPFFTTKAEGTGLGLAICKRIVEAHGGRIEVGPGGRPGAEVIVTLPRRTP